MSIYFPAGTQYVVDANGVPQPVSPTDPMPTIGGNFKLLKDDTTTTGSTYYGQAIPGALTSAASWQITRVDSDGSIYYAGTGAFDQVWDNRSALVYA